MSMGRRRNQVMLVSGADAPAFLQAPNPREQSGLQRFWTILGRILAGFIKKCFDSTVDLVKHISRLLQSVESARIIAQNFLFDGGR